MERKISNSSFPFSISSWWQPCQLSNSRVCSQRWLMSDGSQICACVCVCSCSQHPAMWVIETRHTPPDLSAVRSTLFVSTSLPLSLYSLSSGIPSIILDPKSLFASGTRMFKGPFVANFLSDAIIWWRLRYYRGRRSLLFVSLNTHNKQRVLSAATLLPFTLSLALCVAWLHADTWFEFEPCRLRANIRHALNLSHILMDDRVDRQFANCLTIPLALCLLPYLFDWIQGMRPARKRQRKWEGYDGWTCV